MTLHEKIVVSAYTGVLMCDFGDLHEYIESVMGRPVMTHELASRKFMDELKERVCDDFMAICNDKGGE